MVIYNNKEWFNALINFYRSYVMRVLLRYVLVMGVVTSIICVLILDVFKTDIRFHAGTFSLLGIVLSILLVFRTNTAYDRWWEGRKLWGGLVNTSRNMALGWHALLSRTDTENRSFFAKHLVNFAFALKEHLRKGVKLEELHHLTESEKQQYSRHQHIPSYIVSHLYERTQQLYRNDVISGYDLVQMKTHISAMVDILGACERIKKTPIPFSYSIYIKIFILAYTIILPFGLVEEFRYYTIPVVMLIFFAFVGVELLAEEIEDPFELDCNDLPTGTIATTIKNNVSEILCLFSEVEKEEKQELFEKIF